MTIFLDTFDGILRERVNAHKGISIKELLTEYPELTDVPYSTLWWRLNSLAANGYIRVERARGQALYYSVE